MRPRRRASSTACAWISGASAPSTMTSMSVLRGAVTRTPSMVSTSRVVSRARCSRSPPPGGRRHALKTRRHGHVELCAHRVRQFVERQRRCVTEHPLGLILPVAWPELPDRQVRPSGEWKLGQAVKPMKAGGQDGKVPIASRCEFRRNSRSRSSLFSSGRGGRPVTVEGRQGQRFGPRASSESRDPWQAATE